MMWIRSLWKKLIAGNSEVDFDGDPVPVGRYKDINFYKYSIAYIIAGVVLGLAAMWTLIIPNRDKAADSSQRDLQITFSREIADKNVSISELQSQVDTLTNQLQNSETEAKSLKSQIDKYGDYASQVLSDDNKTRVQSAISKYEEMSYEAALDDLNKVLQDTPNSDVALYFKGMCYLKLSDENNATLVFNQLVENCPNSVYYTYACEHADADAIQAGKNKAAQSTGNTGTASDLSTDGTTAANADGTGDTGTDMTGDGTIADTSYDGTADTTGADTTDYTGAGTGDDGTDYSGDGTDIGADNTTDTDNSTDTDTSADTDNSTDVSADNGDSVEDGADTAN